MIVEREKHTCLNCRFYQKGAHYDCHENIDELVIYKDQPNFCDYFSLKEITAKEKAPSAEEAFDKFFNI